MHVCGDGQSGKKTSPTFMHLFVYSGERKFPAVLAPPPGGQELGSVRFLLTDKNLYTTQISKDKAFVDYNIMPFKKGFPETCILLGNVSA